MKSPSESAETLASAYTSAATQAAPAPADGEAALAFRKSDNLRFEFSFSFGLGHEVQDPFVNEVPNGRASSIRQFSEFSHRISIEFV